MYLALLYCIMAVVCRLYEMLYPCICNVVISCWKSGAYDYVICHGGTDMCFVPGSGWKHLDLEQYRTSGLTTPTYQRSRRWLLSLSLETSGKYSPGAQPTCLEYHANSRSTPYASSKTRSR